MAIAWGNTAGEIPFFTFLYFLPFAIFLYPFDFLVLFFAASFEALSMSICIMAASNYSLANSPSYSPRYYVEEPRRKFADFIVKSMQDYPLKPGLS